MSTAGGPKLAGIGRSGDSDIVLCMDAHDAGSYPGEPTTNTIINGYFPGTDTTTVPTGWARHYSASKIGFRPAGEDFFYKNLGLSNPRVYKCIGGGWYSDSGTGFIGIQMPQPTPGFSTSTATTVSFWYRFTGENAAQLSNQTIFFDFDYGLANLTKINYTDYNDTEWHFYSETQTSSGSYAYYNLYIYAGSLYSVCPGGSYFEIGAVQVEQKGYATPFVGDGQFARPASVNLMIHGDVGTGTSFEDSSPSKHTITANGNTTHSGAQSKFSGGSIYFDGTGDYLSVSDSADWDYGTGAFTIDMWAYISSSSVSYSGLLTMNSPQVSMRLNNVGRLQFLQDAGGTRGNTDDNDTSGTNLRDDAWHHLAVVRQASGAWALYVDGTSEYSGTGMSGDITGVSAIAVGRREDSIGYYLTGYLDEVRVTKGTALWTSAFTPPTRRNLSAPVVDLSGSNNGGNFNTTDMTDVSTYRVGQVIEPVASAVWDFDGTDDFINLGKMVDPAATIGTNGTMCLWINPAVVDTSDYIWSKNVSSSGTTYVICKFTSNDYINLKMYGNWGWGPNIYTGTISANTWTYIVCTWYTDGYAIYKDGVLADSAVESGTWGGAGSTEIWLGDNDSNDGGNPFQGKMGAAALYKSSLSATQIKQNFNTQRSRFKV